MIADQDEPVAASAGSAAADIEIMIVLGPQEHGDTNLQAVENTVNAV